MVLLSPYNPAVSTDLFNLAIETSGRVGSFVIGSGDRIIEAIDLPPQTGGAGSGGSSQFMQMLDATCRALSIQPRQIGEVYLSIGPGSFTGLRVGVTIAKMFALVLGAKIVAVPTLDVVTLNAPDDVQHVAVGLNLKKETLYSGIFSREGDSWRAVCEPALRSISQIFDLAPRPLALLGDPLPVIADIPDDVVILPAALARAQARHLWKLGRIAAAAGAYCDPLALVPLYVRPPEAVELWDARHGKPATA